MRQNVGLTRYIASKALILVCTKPIPLTRKVPPQRKAGQTNVDIKHMHIHVLDVRPFTLGLLHFVLDILIMNKL